MEIEVTNLRINYRAREWCKLPYPLHPHGCPNYGKKPTCPPFAPLFEDVIDLSKSIRLVAVGFNLEEHIRKMKLRHPHWSYRQCKNLLYWQGTVNTHLRACSAPRPGEVVLYCPEAMGINVIATARLAGIPIETKPTRTVFKIALICTPRGWNE